MSVNVEDSCGSTRKKPSPSKLVAFDKVSRRLSLSSSRLNYAEKGEGRFCSLVQGLLQQKKENSLRQHLPS